MVLFYLISPFVCCLYPLWLEGSHPETQEEMGTLLEGQSVKRQRATVLLLPLVDY